MGRLLQHLLVVTLEDPSDPLSWSGIPFSLCQSFKKYVDRVTILSKLKPKRTLLNGMLRFALGGNPPRYPLWMTTAALQGFAQTVAAAVAREKPQAILSISSQCLLYLAPQSIPVAIFADAPWLAWKQAYSRYEGVPLLGSAYARKEAAAAARCDALFFASKWATDEAQRLYKIDGPIGGDRLHVTPLGASWVPNLTGEELLTRIRNRDRKSLRLLFVGKDWERKGGPMAVEIARELILQLQASGQSAELHIVGCRPEIAERDRSFVHIHGMLSRANPEESGRMRQLFLDAHFLVVPTDAECFGIVFAEAFAHGLPAVSRRVDAVPSIVDDGVSGVLEDRTAPAAPYAARILEVFRDRERYETMAIAGRRKYETSLTWDACAEKIVRTLSALRKPTVEQQIGLYPPVV